MVSANKKWLVLALPVTLMAVAGVQARAAEAPRLQVGDWTAGLPSGTSLPAESSGAIVSASFGATGTVGVRGGYVSVEEQLGTSANAIDALPGKAGASGIGWALGSVRLNGSVDSMIGLTNVLVTPMGKPEQKQFTPYFGGGLGFVNLDEKLTTSSPSGAAATGASIDSTFNQTDLAADGIVGLDYNLSKAMTVGARYQLLWFDTANSTSAAGATTTGNRIAHVMTLEAQLAF